MNLIVLGILITVKYLKYHLTKMEGIHNVIRSEN